MSYSIFQTTTATMKKMTTDGFGKDTASLSFTVKIDPGLGKKTEYNTDGQMYTGLSTVITAHDSFDVTHDNWRLDYNGREYQIEDMVPMYSIGGNVLEHVEVTLR